MNNIKVTVIFTVLGIVLLSGCATTPLTPKVQKDVLDDNVTTYSYTADLRSTHVIKNGDRYWFMSEPMPDAAFSYDEKEEGDFNLAILGKSEGGDEESGSGTEDLPLTGRVPYVVLAREMNFRLNEMAYNTNATFEQYMEAYKLTLKVIHDIAKREAPNNSHKTAVSVNTGAYATTDRSDKYSDTHSLTREEIEANQQLPDQVAPASWGDIQAAPKKHTSPRK